jgi:hypothetical protein
MHQARILERAIAPEARNQIALAPWRATVVTNDEVISAFLERQNPAEHDDFIDACGRAIVDATVVARKVLRPYQNKLDVDEVLGKAAERALTLMYRQFLGDKDGFHLKAETGMTFETWFLQIVDFPGAELGAALLALNLTERCVSTSVKCK